MTEFTRLIKYLTPYRIIFAISVILMIATGLLEGGTILLLRPIFDTLSGKGGALTGLPFGDYLPKSGGIDLRVVVVLLVGLTLAKGVCEYFSSYFMNHIGQCVIDDVRSSLQHAIINEAAQFFSKYCTAR